MAQPGSQQSSPASKSATFRIGRGDGQGRRLRRLLDRG